MTQTHIFYISGSIVDIRPEPIKKSVASLQQFSQQLPDTTFRDIHNFKWKEVCKEFRFKQDQLILIGQSWGGQAVLDIAKCLAPYRDVELGITIDRIPKGWFSRTVGNHILHHYNFYQREAPLLQGTSEHIRPDGSDDRIENKLIKTTPSDFSPHDQIVWDIVKDGSLLSILRDHL